MQLYAEVTVIDGGKMTSLCESDMYYVIIVMCKSYDKSYEFVCGRRIEVLAEHKLKKILKITPAAFHRLM